jgi:hypothetical protein
MKLRSKLTAAFVLMAVVPLALVTVASYRASVRAFRQAVEAEATSLAGDMSQRMEIVSSELGRRVERMWDMPGTVPGELSRTSSDPAMRIPAGIADALGATALLLERVKVVPLPPAAGETPREHREFVLQGGVQPPPLPPTPPIPHTEPLSVPPPPPP